jgi:inosine-uridine nucleoside N-ribohydrolase
LQQLALGVDDAFALPLVMHSKELSIEAITAVSGNLPLELTLASAAAAAVFDSGVPIVIVGLNVTERVRLNDTHVQRLEAANNSSSLARAASPETASHL